MRGLTLLFLGAFLAATSLFAAEVKLKDGTAYHDVKILERTDQYVRITVPYGEMKLPLGKVESIDGKAVVETAPTSDKAQLANAIPPPPPPYVHRWTMDIFLLGMWLVMMTWIMALLWVQHDARGMPEEIRRANANVLLVPFLGFLKYLFMRRRHRGNDEAPAQSLEGRVAGVGIDEVPKKRGLFGGRTKNASNRGARKQRVGIEFLDVGGQMIDIRQDLPEMTGIEAAREVLADAITERASDIHLEPQGDGCRVRFRVDGTLQERMTFTKVDGTRVVAALKTLAQIDVAEKRRAQDGRFRVRAGTDLVDFRAATANGIHGEKLVLRILDRRSGVLGLTELGMPPEMLERFDRVIHSRNGIILATGPTGAGKTSTLYAALSRLDRNALNIMSIEDPVEYELEGTTQIPVNVKAGVTYEAGLRSILRQDPNVIFVGEMRDTEAATIAIRAALTGHLVFSSLHSKDAVGTVIRLEEMGVERYQISSALLMVVAQRLVRVLCKKCRKAYAATGTELSEIGIQVEPGRRLYSAIGCGACDNTGYRGRTGIFELLVMDEELRKAVNDGANEQVMSEIASRKGLRSYREDGLDKILNGITSVEDVIQAS